MSDGPALAMRSVSLRYGETLVLDCVDLEVSQGETLALLGPSGCGKTSLLYVAAGFAAPSGGEVRMDGHLVADARRQVPPEARRVGVVFQHYALWPHLTALETVAYPLRRQGMDATAARTRAAALLELMGVASLAHRRPAQLSGGEQQRVGVARALARAARLLLLDEPTAHLDTPLRASLMAELSARRRDAGAAAIYATHDVGEAMAVADRVALMRDGRLVQVGLPGEIYDRPVDAWAARLSGPASVLRATVASNLATGRLRLGGQEVTVALEGRHAAAGEDVELLVRPDWSVLGGDLPGLVTAVFYRGPHTDYRIETAAGQLELREPGQARAAVGETVTWTLRRAWVLGG